MPDNQKPEYPLQPANCVHRVKDLRICDMFPTRYYECSTCGAMFHQEVVAAYNAAGSTQRLQALVRALAGLSADDRPLQAFLVPGIRLQDAWPLWPDGKVRVVQGGPSSDDEAEPDPGQAWRRAG